jgi:hypothetical protein
MLSKEPVPGRFWVRTRRQGDDAYRLFTEELTMPFFLWFLNILWSPLITHWSNTLANVPRLSNIQWQQLLSNNFSQPLRSNTQGEPLHPAPTGELSYSNHWQPLLTRVLRHPLLNHLFNNHSYLILSGNLSIHSTNWQFILTILFGELLSHTFWQPILSDARNTHWQPAICINFIQYRYHLAII